MREIEVPSWLEGLPMAPEFRPTDTEFADPISYISKIEKQASAFGICKVIPPLPKPSKKYVYYNLNKSLLERPELGSEGEKADDCSLGKYDNDVRRAVFTTRQQELGVKRSREAIQRQQQGFHKQVWQSGEIYTIEQFESKSKAFSKSMLGTVKDSSPLAVESMFWEAASDKPIYIEYANDVPGSGFSEPDGSFRYFHRRRRKRVSRKNHQVRSVCKKYGEDDTVRDSLCNSNKDEGGTTNSSGQVPKASTILSVLALDGNEANSQENSSDAFSELEGTAGWKLSNSPWNLQVISRSPGSLTRFMPDDIPGVTSPMVYIGMLFSWFAWHVEDHELHSLNFLHTGSPKTWYAVPGDYAFAFEEVIRTHAYGGSIDRLAALSLLGEKTTLLSPEVVVGSKIPCCRLIQNPGEFVVTFPRAYHVGFSHGFNCGEAANFGTSQWLKVAKEAAVRRAAMNYLPMLSHQQLLYLLTMSFVSRVPRSLLPGARSSRLRDRQKEERELSVKKAFVADVVNENKLLAILIGKHPSYRSVLWDPESLPSISRESQLPADMANATSTSGENISHFCSETNPTRNSLLDDLSLYMENVNHLYTDDDDFLSDFHVDSGTVACVSCGILGFPFMSVIQPSETASLELLPSNTILDKKDIGISKCVNSSSDQEGTVNKSILEDCTVGSLIPENMPRPSLSKFGKEWNTSSRFLRPRIFCLEHAIQIEELLQSRGGANVLVICHSDYQKIKAHAVAVADEIGSPPFSTEVLLDDATEQDLNLIDFAVEEEEQHGSVEDWSSKLGINLHYCVKIRKNSPSMQVQHALKLGGITSDSAGSSALNFKWQSRKTRSKVNLNYADHLNGETKNEKDEELMRTSEQSMVQKTEQIIQYTRRNSKPKSVGSLGKSRGHVHCKQVSATTSSNPSKLRVTTYATNRSDIRTSKGNIYETNSSNSRESGSDSEASGACGSLEDVLFEIQVSEESNVITRLSSIGDGTSERQSKVSIYERRPTEEKLMSFTGNFVGTHVIPVPTFEMLEEIDLVEVDVELEDRKPVRMGNYVGMCLMQSDGRDASMAVTSKFQASHIFHDLDLVEEGVDAHMMNLPVGRSCTMDEMIEGTSDEHFTCTAVKSVCRNDEICNNVPGDSKVGNENTSTDLRNEDLFPGNALLVNNLGQSSVEASSDVASEICYKELAQELTTVADCAICKEDSNTLGEKGAVGNLSGGATSNEEQKLQSAVAKDMRKPISGDLMLIICPAHSSKISGDSYTEVNLDCGLQQVRTINGSSEEEIISSNLVQIDKSTACSLEERSDFAKETVPKYLCDDYQVCSSEVSMESPSRSSFEDVPGVPNEIVMETNSDGGLHPILTMDNGEVADPSLNNVVNCNQRTVPPVEGNIDIPIECDGSKACSSQVDPPPEDLKSTPDGSELAARPKAKRKRELDQLTDEIYNFNYIRSPCEGLRSRVGKDSSKRENAASEMVNSKPPVKRMRQQKSDGPIPTRDKSKQESYRCDLEGCRMRFKTKGELLMHQRNQCPVQGCRKKFSCHRYAVVHHRVHKDERPLKCSWKGCTMTFKWAWARTEHLRVHTGERPYKCKVEGCGLSFRFISDFSRHRRKVGHYVNLPT